VAKKVKFSTAKTPKAPKPPKFDTSFDFGANVGKKTKKAPAGGGS